MKRPKVSESTNNSLIVGLAYGGKSLLGFSSDEDEDSEAMPGPAIRIKTEAEYIEEDKLAAAVEFKRVLKTWAKHQVDWARNFPGKDLGTLDIVEDLMDLDMGVVYLDLIKSDPLRATFGFMPLLASCSEGELGAVNAESYAERVISASNITMDHGNTSMSDDLYEMLVVLRMNRDFMIFMRKNYFAEIKALQPFNMTVVKLEDEV